MRWRDVKQGKITECSEIKEDKNLPSYASNTLRAKAFITDAFLLSMPIFYIVVYLVFDGLRGEGGVEGHRMMSWVYILLPLGIIVALFGSISGQTPGLKSQNLRLIDNSSGKKPNFILSFLRFIFFNIAFFSGIGLLVGLFRNDGRGIADLLSGTSIIKENDA
jgi:uncharacterized RDD family membrane protein YckC